MASYISDLTELTAPASNDLFLVSDVSDPANRDKKMLLSRMAIKSGTPTAGRLASWTDANQIQDGGFLVSDLVRKTGTAPVAGRVASWADANQIQDGGFAVSDIARLSVANVFTGTLTAATIIGAAFRSVFIAALADDAAYDHVYTGQGAILVTVANSTNLNRYLLAAFRSNSGPVMQSMVIGSDFLVSTATLTGTTGTDGKATISATNGHIYIENRLGSALSFSMAIFV